MNVMFSVMSACPPRYPWTYSNLFNLDFIQVFPYCNVDNVDIFVQLLMRINGKWLLVECILMQPYIYHDALY